MRRPLILAYGLITYAIFFATFLYLIGFVGDLMVPRTVDSGGAESPMGLAILINVSMVALFGVQHGVMARPGFKRWWTRIVHPAAERSTFVLVTSLILMLMFWQWRPLTDVVWSVEGPLAIVLWSIFGLGWAVVLLSTFLIDHFELFGLKQTVMFFLRREAKPPVFVERMLYKWVRHPLMLGFLMAFWSIPHMTLGHLVFAGSYTLFILIALHFEERDLLAAHGPSYEDYRRRVSMLLPLPKAKKQGGVEVA